MVANTIVPHAISMPRSELPPTHRGGVNALNTQRHRHFCYRQRATMGRITLLTLVVFIVGVIASSSALDLCQTPLGEDGFCVTIDKCAPYLKLMSRTGPYTSNEQYFMRSLHCGWHGSQPKLCCVAGCQA